MLPTLELLRDELIKSYEILDFKSGESFYYLKVKAVFLDDSVLHVREYASSQDYLYSYHWQEEDGSLRIRWDNSPHHDQLKTFPSHKHAPQLQESDEVSLKDVLETIRKELRKRSCRE